MNAAPAQSPTAATPRFNATLVALSLLAIVTMFRLWYATRCLGLVGDEAFYWLWSKHLAASYTDKGPAIAWIIRAGTWLFGDTTLGIRFFGVFLGAGTGWQIFRLARRFYDDRTALWCLLCACVIPIFALGSVIMTVDAPSVFCWAWAANVFWTALETGKVRHWFGLGLIIGAGFLAKYTNGVQLLCIALFLLWSAPHRRFLFSRQSFALVLAFVLCSLPMLWWNYQVGWLQFTALHSRSGVQNSFHIHPLKLLAFVGEEFGVLSPLIGIGMAVAVIGLLFSRHRDPHVRFLLCQCLPLFGLFSFFSLNAIGKANWAAPAFVTGIVLLVVFWKELVRRRPGWRWAVHAALGVASLMTLGLHLLPFTSLPAFNHFVRRAQGWPDLAAHIEQARSNHHATLLIANHYWQASLAEFYLADHPRVFLATGANPQFKIWGEYRLTPGTRALFITNDPQENGNDMGPPLTDEFKTRKLVDDFWNQYRGKNMWHFRIYLLVAADSDSLSPPLQATTVNPPARDNGH